SASSSRQSVMVDSPPRPAPAGEPEGPNGAIGSKIPVRYALSTMAEKSEGARDSPQGSCDGAGSTSAVAAGGGSSGSPVSSAGGTGGGSGRGATVSKSGVSWGSFIDRDRRDGGWAGNHGRSPHASDHWDGRRPRPAPTGTMPACDAPGPGRHGSPRSRPV